MTTKSDMVNIEVKGFPSDTWWNFKRVAVRHHKSLKTLLCEVLEAYVLQEEKKEFTGGVRSRVCHRRGYQGQEATEDKEGQRRHVHEAGRGDRQEMREDNIKIPPVSSNNEWLKAQHQFGLPDEARLLWIMGFNAARIADYEVCERYQVERALKDIEEANILGTRAIVPPRFKED